MSFTVLLTLYVHCTFSDINITSSKLLLESQQAELGATPPRFTGASVKSSYSQQHALGSLSDTPH